MGMMVAMALDSNASKQQWGRLFGPLASQQHHGLDRARLTLYMANVRLHEGEPLEVCEESLFEAIEVFRNNDALLEESLGWAQLALLNAVCGSLPKVKAAALRALAFDGLPAAARFRLLGPLVESLLALGETDQLRRIMAEGFVPMLAAVEAGRRGRGLAHCGMAYMKLWLAVEGMGLRINSNQHLPGGEITIRLPLSGAAAAAISEAETHLRQVREEDAVEAGCARLLWGALYALRGQLERGLTVLRAGPPASGGMRVASIGMQAFMLRLHGQFSQALAMLDTVGPQAPPWRLLWAHCLFERSVCLQQLGDFFGAHHAMSACAQLNMALRVSTPAQGDWAGGAGRPGLHADERPTDMRKAPAYLHRVIDLMSGRTMPWADLTLDAVAQAVGVSRRTVQAALQKHRHRSFTELRRELRMSDAAQLLKCTELTVDVIAEQLGYATRSLFYSDFRTVFRQAPLSYRKASRRSQA